MRLLTSHFKIVLVLAFSLGLASCDFFNGEQEAFATAKVNGEGWSALASASYNDFVVDNIDIQMLKVDVSIASRETLTLVDIPLTTGQFTILKYPVNSPTQNDPYQYYNYRSASDSSITRYFILDNQADNFIIIDNVEEDVMEGEFQITLVSVKPELTPVDTLVFREGIFSVVL